jgi:PAS domain S-box-containing protein
MVYVSRNISLFGYDPAEMMASQQFYRACVHPDDAAKVWEQMALAARDDGRPAAFEFRLSKPDGGYRWVENHLTTIRDAAGRLIEIEGTLTDVTERKEVDEKIALLAGTDSLTGLAGSYSLAKA